MPKIFENFQSSSEQEPLFSIIIPVRNEEHNIAKCLSALSNSQIAPHVFEIIVVDNGSTDRTREVAAGFVSTSALRVLDWPNAYIAAVRNAGAAVAQGKYFAFLDSDYEFCQRVRSIGHPITCIPELGVIHWGTPQSLVAFYRKHRWHGMHVFRVFLRNLPALHNFKPIALALYTLCCMLGLLISIGIALQGGSLRYLDAFVLALLVPPLALGIRSAASVRRLGAIVPVAALYLAYGLARASSIVDWRHWSRHSGRMNAHAGSKT